MKNKNNDSINILMWIALVYFTLFYSISTFGQVKYYDGELYDVVYSEDYQQPLQVTYKIMCPTGEISRSGLLETKGIYNFRQW